MKPLPVAVHQLLDTLPPETCRVTLNTNRRGHWEIEVVAHYSLDEPPVLSPEAMAADCRAVAQRQEVSRS